MAKESLFFKGDPAEAELFGPAEKADDLEVITGKQKKEWLKRRNAARKNPPSYALVQKPEVYK